MSLRQEHAVPWAAHTSALAECTVACPYCGEALTLTIDASAGAQRYIEDCAVCCRPIEIAVETDDEGFHVVAQHENEA
jgi:hypothetical protein